ncbi:unnamed protein product [Spodoptera littoralis]|uniref:Uncharacterized protein n=1 Tax=Spodoptera littoralis TaxID=7109 RepID=A0A9P0N6L0_SPOLI|nr:unnamed protein product [Spodoptera littoralis]CAH1643399.1 unnamed protein product [Spodoptera littoralis]
MSIASNKTWRIKCRSKLNTLGSSKSCFSSDSSKKRHSSPSGSISTDLHNRNLDKRLLKTFENFILQLDELLLTLKAEEHLKSDGYIPEFTSYQDICEKLRLEVLIAIDKLQLISFSGSVYNENNMEFLNKMNTLKFQLSDIRGQYHNAIKDFNFRLNDDKN